MHFNNQEAKVKLHLSMTSVLIWPLKENIKHLWRIIADNTSTGFNVSLVIFRQNADRKSDCYAVASHFGVSGFILGNITGNSRISRFYLSRYSLSSFVPILLILPPFLHTHASLLLDVCVSPDQAARLSNSLSLISAFHLWLDIWLVTKKLVLFFGSWINSQTQRL